MDGFNEKKWFVYMTDHHEGPFSLAEIQAKMAQSQITLSNYVWAEGMSDWKAMTDVPEFASILTQDAPAATAMEHAEPMIVSDEPAAMESLESAAPPEKTGSLDATDIQRSMDQATRAPLIEIPIAATATIPLTKKSVPAQPAAPVAAKPKTSSSRMIKWAVLILVPAGLAAAYLNGSLDPVLNSPAVKASGHAASDMAQPYLLKLAEKVPALGKWISPIPALEDVSSEDYETLKAAAVQKPEEGIKLAIAASTADLFMPAFYVASNLPNGAAIDVYVEGIPDTLLNQLSFSGKVQATLDKKLGKTGPARFADGKPLPRGEYVVYATESQQQPDSVKAILANVPPVTVKVPDNLPRGLKLLVSKPVFLGGAKDTTYESRLKDFHDKLRAKAGAELSEVKQLSATLEGQLTATNTKYTQLHGLARNGKPSFAAKKAWNDFSTQWSKLDTQLKDGFAKWTDQALQTEYFYGMLYSLTKSAGDAVEKLHQLHSDFFDGKIDPRTFEIQHGSSVSIAQNAISALKSKIDQAEHLAPTPNGMPRREGL